MKKNWTQKEIWNIVYQHKDKIVTLKAQNAKLQEEAEIYEQLLSEAVVETFPQSFQAQCSLFRKLLKQMCKTIAQAIQEKIHSNKYYKIASEIAYAIPFIMLFICILAGFGALVMYFFGLFIENVDKLIEFIRSL